MDAIASSPVGLFLLSACYLLFWSFDSKSGYIENFGI